MLSPNSFFKAQLEILKNSITDNCLIMGDFNLDVKMIGRSDYSNKVLLSHLNNYALENDLTQLVDFCTWNRTIKGTKKESLIDHVYVNNFAAINDTTYSIPPFGDHVLVIIDLNGLAPTNKIVKEKRDWTKYSKDRISDCIKSSIVESKINWNDLSVCEHWNILEDLMIKAVDLVSPLRDHCDDINCIKKSYLPSFITRKINQRKRFLKLDKNKLIPCNSAKIKDLDRDIRTYFSVRRVSSVRKAANGEKLLSLLHCNRTGLSLRRMRQLQCCWSFLYYLLI